VAGICKPAVGVRDNLATGASEAPSRAATTPEQSRVQSTGRRIEKWGGVLLRTDVSPATTATAGARQEGEDWGGEGRGGRSGSRNRPVLGIASLRSTYIA